MKMVTTVGHSEDEEYVELMCLLYFITSAYCFLVFVHFFISRKLKSQSKSVSATSEMFTEFLDTPALVFFFLLLFIWYVLYLKGGCVTYCFLLRVQCATQILLKKPETAFFLVCRSRTDTVWLHASKNRRLYGLMLVKSNTSVYIKKVGKEHEGVNFF